MIENLVFHIGDPKNGSSSIQSVLFDQLWTCESRSLAPPTDKNAIPLANSLKSDRTEDQRAQLFGETARWAADSDADYGVISSEYFFRMDPAVLKQALRDYLPAHAESTRIIAYARPHAERFVSTYAQRVKSGAFNLGMPRFLTVMKNSKPLNYYRRFSKWRAVFGDNFTLRPFTRSAMIGQDVVTDFFHHVLEGAPFTLQDLKQANQALYVKEIAGMRAFQGVLIKQETPRNLCAVVGGIIGRSIAEIPGRSGTKLALDHAAALDLAANLRHDAVQIDADFFKEPLFQQSLDAAIEKAIPDPQSTQPKDHFSAGELKEIRALAKQVSMLIEENPQMWRTTSRMMRGTMDQAALDGLEQSNLHAGKTAVDLSTEIARLIA